MLGGLLLLISVAGQTETPLTIDADHVVSRVSRYLTGACIEDVNHELYGGIYSQMVFGESFQEPAPSSPIKGFTALGGNWHIGEGNVIDTPAGDGPKLIADDIRVGDGTVSVDILFPKRASGVAGIIVRVANPRVGMDTFTGYEIALDAERDLVVVGRHRDNWQHIGDTPCAVPINQWMTLSVALAGPVIEVSLDGKPIARQEDREAPLPAGGIGIRPFRCTCQYRNLRAGSNAPIPFAYASDASESVSGQWRVLRRGTARGLFAQEYDRPFVGTCSQRVAFSEGTGELGIENQGLNRRGMAFVKDKPYEGRVWARAAAPAEFDVALESGDGERTFARSALRVEGTEWQPLDFVLTPNTDAAKGRLAILLKQPADIVFGYVSLQPGEWGRFKGLPVRADVANGLIEQGLTVLRCGGSMVNAPEYRWKNMIGPRDRRPPHKGFWYPYSTNGWGIIDFLDFCEAAGFLAVPAFNMDETPQDMADFVEYVNGDAESPWGSRRAANGHPAPYGLKHMELGNEEKVDAHYAGRFEPMAKAVWEKDPNMTLVVGDFLYGAPIENPFDFKGSPVITSLEGQKRILEFAKANGKPVWFDVHIGNDEPQQPDLAGTRSFIDHLGRLCPGADYKVCIFEENANNHRVRRALGHAHAINQVERLGDRIPILCAANCLQPDGQNDNGWDQGLLFLNPSKVWGQASYYVTQMVSRYRLPLCVDTACESPSLSASAKTNDERSVLTLQVVNFGDKSVDTRVRINGFTPKQPTARAGLLTGALDDKNTDAEPERIIPVWSDWPHHLANGETHYTFPPYSFTLLRFE